jgi:hypothetical protein
LGIHALADQLKATPISLAISGSDTVFPLLECVHVVAVATVVGSIAIVDLRLMGLRARNRDVNELLRQLVPIALGAFVVAFVAGVFMFIAKPDTYIDNIFFDVKMGLLALAGANMLTFHLVFGRALAGVGTMARLPLSARISGALSLSVWVAIVACGRWIGFTT